MKMNNRNGQQRLTVSIVALLTCAVLAAAAGCSKRDSQAGPRTFGTADQAVNALADAVKKGNLDEVIAIFGPDGRALIDSSDPDTARRNREVFAVAVSEKWHLEDQGPDRKILVIGNEDWPFPVPLAKQGGRWHFDTTAGKEEVLDRRIGRNELAAMQVCDTYVRAQHVYARHGHDGHPQGVYARSFHSDPGRQNGLFWPTGAREKRSPLGDLLADAEAAEARRSAAGTAQPFHGYYFKILTAQGDAAPGGARSYVVGDKMTGGFALVAWPAHYDSTGVMTFLVNQDGVIHEKDLGRGTETEARDMTVYNPDGSWETVR